MNINDVKKSNTDIQSQNTKVYGLKNFMSQNNDGNNFSYYVEVSKTREIKNKSQGQNDENVIENPEENKILQEEMQDENTPITYIQTFNTLNSEIFDMGIEEENNDFSNKNIFKYNINLTDMTLNDIKLFDNLAQSKEVVVNSVDLQNQSFNMQINGENLNISYRSLEVSKTLFSALEQASKTGKSVRLDFGKDTSVILRINRDGKLSADFVPNEKAMELVLKNALPQLKARLEEQNIPYGELNYKQYNGQKDNQKNNNKEKKDE